MGWSDWNPVSNADDWYKSAKSHVGNPLNINTYSDPLMEGLSKIDEEALGGFLFGGIEYRPDLSTTPDYNINDSTLRYMTPDRARTMAEREFINQRMANFRTVGHDANTASSMPLWDYYNAVGDKDSANAALFQAAREEFSGQYKPVEYDDWGNPLDYAKQFGNVQSVTQREQNPYLYDVLTDSGKYTYVPGALAAGLTGDRRAVETQQQTGTDEQGNPIFTTVTSDAPGQTAIWGDGIDWTKGQQVVLDPSKVGGLNSLRVGDFDYDIQGGGLNQGFFFNDADLANFNLQRGEQNARLVYPDVQGGMAGDVGPLLQIAGGVMAATGVGAVPGGIVAGIGAGLNSAQQQKLADDMRAAGYDVDEGSLRRGHALNAASTAMAFAAPGISDYFNTNYGLAAGTMGNAAATGATTGAVMGGVGDRNNFGQGALAGGALGASTAALTHGALDTMGFDPKMGSTGLARMAMSGEISKYLKENVEPFRNYYDNLNKTNYDIDPNANLGDLSSVNAARQSATLGTGPQFTDMDLADYRDKAYDLATGFVKNPLPQFDALSGTGYGVPGYENRDQAQASYLSQLAMSTDELQRMLASQGMNKGMGAGSAGGLGQMQVGGIQGAGGFA